MLMSENFVLTVSVFLSSSEQILKQEPSQIHQTLFFHHFFKLHFRDSVCFPVTWPNDTVSAVSATRMIGLKRTGNGRMIGSDVEMAMTYSKVLFQHLPVDTEQNEKSPLSG